MARPDYVHCIRHPHNDQVGKTWCGRTIQVFEFAFVDTDHAAMNGLAEGSSLACSRCVSTVSAALKKGMYTKTVD